MANTEASHRRDENTPHTRVTLADVYEKIDDVYEKLRQEAKERDEQRKRSDYHSFGFAIFVAGVAVLIADLITITPNAQLGIAIFLIIFGVGVVTMPYWGPWLVTKLPCLTRKKKL